MRSVRPQDPDIAAPLHGIAAFSGGVAPIVNDLSTVAQNLSADTSVAAAAYHRTSDRSAPHNLYATASKLWALAAIPTTRRPSRCSSTARSPAGATPASSVDVPLSGVADVRWTWDGKAWRRSQDGVPFTVTGTGRIGPANVILQYVQIASAGYQDVAGTPVPSTVVIGTGKAQLLRDGKVITGTWSKLSRARRHAIHDGGRSADRAAARADLGRTRPEHRDRHRDSLSLGRASPPVTSPKSEQQRAAAVRCRSARGSAISSS